MSGATRNTDLLKARNKAIVERYVHLYEIKRIRFEDVLYKLKWEYFFMSERKIKEIIRKAGVSIPYVHKINLPHRNDLQLKEARNNKILDRFSTLSNEKKMRFDDTVTHLANHEFYISKLIVERVIYRWKPVDNTNQQEKLF